MSKLILISIAFLFLVSCASKQKSEEARVSFQALKQQKVVDGCGCYLKDSSGYYYWNDFGQLHYLNIGGKDRVYSNCQTSGSTKRLGDKYTLQCSDRFSKLRIEFEVTSSCKGKEACEFTTRNAKLYSSFAPNQSFTLQGGCGC